MLNILKQNQYDNIFHEHIGVHSLKSIIDLATLTGAIIVALGDRYAGLFSNATDIGIYCKMLIDGGFYLGNRYFSTDLINDFTTLLSSIEEVLIIKLMIASEL